MPATSYSPLRYPGGKSRLTNFMKLVVKANNLENGVYVEPFAGGAGVALGLLLDGFVNKIIINDIDSAIFCFWDAVLNHTDELCNKIQTTPVTMEQWYQQKQIFDEKDISDALRFGFATFFLNRTNRSGILNAGVIGGKSQAGDWKLDARYRKDTLVKKIRTIAGYRDRITLTNLDARELIKRYGESLPDKSLIYLDPPYYHKGQKLYLNALQPDDHILIAHCIKTRIKGHWITSYDNTPEISDLYLGYRQTDYNLNYTAANRYHGNEIIIYSNDVNIPFVENPFNLSQKKFEQLRRR